MFLGRGSSGAASTPLIWMSRGRPPSKAIGSDVNCAASIAIVGLVGGISGFGTVVSRFWVVVSGPGAVVSGTGTMVSGIGTVVSGSGAVISGTGIVVSGSGAVASGSRIVVSDSGTIGGGLSSMACW